MKHKVLKITVLVFVLIIIVILAIGPTIAVNQLEKNSKEWIGRKLTIGDFSLNYFTGTVEMDDLTFYEADDITPFVAFDSLYINTELYHLISNEFVIEQISLIGLRTYVTQRDTVFNFDDLIAFYTPQDSLVEEEELIDTSGSDDPMVIKVSNIYVKAKELSYKAMELNHETKMVNLNLHIPYISWNAEAGSHAGLQFDLANNGHFGMDLDYYPDSNEFHANVKVTDLNLATYYVYAERELNISSLTGFLGLNMSIDGNLNEIEKTTVAGNIGLKDFEMDDLKQKKLLAVKELNIGIAKIDNYNQRFVLDSVHLYKAFVDFELLEEGTNFDCFVKESNDTTEVEVIEEEADTLVKPSSDLYYSVHSFKIDDASIEFIDHTTPRLFTYHLSAINMQSHEINSDAEWVKTHLDMLLNKRGKMKVEFGFNPMKPMDMDVDYVLTNFQLSDINIYSEMNTGYPFVYGEMFYYSQTTIRDGQIKSENKLRINDVELGDKVEGWKSIPIKFALFLLKDKNGDVVMDVPVRGDLNDPEINIKKLAWTTFKKAIFKVASAPVDYLAGFAKIDPKDIKTIEFAYLDTVLSSRIEHQLDMLIKLERAKPGLNINMVYLNDVELEKQQIAINELGKIFNDSTKLDYQKDKVAFEGFIKSKTLKDSVDIAKDCLHIYGQSKATIILDKYTSLRYEKVSSYLRQQNDSTRIKLDPYNAAIPKNTGSIPMFEMKYSVEDE